MPSRYPSAWPTAVPPPYSDPPVYQPSVYSPIASPAASPRYESPVYSPVYQPSIYDGDGDGDGDGYGFAEDKHLQHARGPAEREAKEMLCDECLKDDAAIHHGPGCAICDYVYLYCDDVEKGTEEAVARLDAEEDKIEIKLLQDGCAGLVRCVKWFDAHRVRTAHMDKARQVVLNKIWNEECYDTTYTTVDFWKLFEGTSLERVLCETPEKMSVETHVVMGMIPPDGRDDVDYTQLPDGYDDLPADEKGGGGDRL